MHEPEAMSTSVVPVSVMPAVCARMGVPAAPYVIVWLIPTNSFAGATEVIGLDHSTKWHACRERGEQQTADRRSGLHKVDVAGELARVDAAERQLAVDDLRGVRGFK